MTDFSTKPRARQGVLDTVLLAFGGCVLALASFASWQASADLRLRQEEVARATESADEAVERARVAEVRRGSATSVVTEQAQWTLEAPPSRLVGELSGLLPPDVRLESLSFEYRDHILVDMTVRARRSEAYDLFLNRLGESAAFGDVVPGAETRDGELSASVRATYRLAASP